MKEILEGIVKKLNGLEGRQKYEIIYESSSLGRIGVKLVYYKVYYEPYEIVQHEETVEALAGYIIEQYLIEYDKTTNSK